MVHFLVFVTVTSSIIPCPYYLVEHDYVRLLSNLSAAAAICHHPPSLTKPTTQLLMLLPRGVPHVVLDALDCDMVVPFICVMLWGTDRQQLSRQSLLIRDRPIYLVPIMPN